ncbi:MAG: HAD-IC family P-type ATPase [Bacilli bacterium]|nr:HAD-IC family P-type ATPase [Bacilli bacterium]
MNWHSKSIEEIYGILKSTEDGLNTKDVNQKQKEYGKNIIPSKKRDTLPTVFFKQFINPIIYILGFAAFFSLIIGEYADTLFIAIVVLLDAVMGAYQEWQAEKSAESLKKIIRVVTSTLRNNSKKRVDSEQLVPGDIIFLEPGDKVPADARIIVCYNLSIDESFLTGESISTEKIPDIIPEPTSISERNNICYAGSTVMTGRAKCIVVETGLKTEFGKIANDVIEKKDEDTPLVIRMRKFTKQLSIFTFLFSVVLIFILYLKGYILKDIFFLVIALAVSAIPEGLPVILTITLSIVTNRMLKRNVIVRKLNSVEGLGSCTVIASDKTGTLTLNEQTLKVVLLQNNVKYDITGEGYNGIGEIVPTNDEAKCQENINLLNELAKLVTINNEATLEYNENVWKSSGDAIDIALLSFAKKVGVVNTYNVIGRIPYESEKQFSATFYQDNDTNYVTIKGSLEKVLSFCHKKDYNEVKQKHDQLSKEGYRIIAVAKGEKKDFIEKIGYEDSDISKLDFVGLLAFIDPIRPDAVSAIKECQKAGIKVVMITGDYSLTASKIALDLKLIKNESEVCTGLELEEYFNEGLERFDEFVKEKKVFSRVSPKQKLEIVNSYKRQKEFVAVTGDGVNDAPALKGANIGIAMGDGSDVTKDVGSIIITDNNFLSIVSGVEEGRFAYENIRKVTYLLISCAISEVLFFMLAILFDMPVPFLAIQLLWLNLITEGIQDTALSFEKGEKDVMKEKPRKTTDSLFDKLLLEETFLAGIVMTIIMFITWVYLNKYLQLDIILSRSYIMLLLVILQNFQTLNCRSERASIFKIPIKNNYFVFISVVLTLVLQIVISETTFLDSVLKIEPIPFIHVIYLFILSTPLLIIMELYKKRKEGKN